MSLLDSMQSAKKAKRDAPGCAIKATTIAVVLGVLLVAGYLFKAFYASKQLARLLHQKDVLEEQKKMKIAEAEQQKLERDRHKAKKELMKINRKIQELDKESEDARKYRDESLNLISRIKDWDDVEKVVVHDS